MSPTPQAPLAYLQIEQTHAAIMNHEFKHGVSVPVLMVRAILAVAKAVEEVGMEIAETRRAGSKLQ